MAITFPLFLGPFWDSMPKETQVRWELVYNQTASVDGGGNMLVSRSGDGRWVGEVSVAPVYMTVAAEIEANIKLLVARNGTFLAYDLRRAYPKDDPGGAEIASFSPLVKSIGSNNRSIAIKNYKSGINVRVGDYLSVTTATSQRVLLQAMEEAPVAGGDTAEFEVQPYLPAGIAVNDAVDFTKPVAKCRIMPGSFRPGSTTGNLTTGIGFSFYSVLN